MNYRLPGRRIDDVALPRSSAAVAGASSPVPLLAQDPPAAGAEPPPVEVDVVGGERHRRSPIAVPAMPTPLDDRRRQYRRSAARSPRSSPPTSQLGPVHADRPRRPARHLLRPGRPRPISPTGAATGAAGARPGLRPGQRQRHADRRLLSLRRRRADASSTRQGYVVSRRDWRRAAHRCADIVYSRLTGEGAYFDTRIVYVSETGPSAAPDQAARDHGL